MEHGDYIAPKRILIMDGTKPAMDSNAEETQDEGQESKGTRHQSPSSAHFCLIKGERGEGKKKNRTSFFFPLSFAPPPGFECARYNSDSLFLHSLTLVICLSTVREPFGVKTKEKKINLCCGLAANPARNPLCYIAEGLR